MKYTEKMQLLLKGVKMDEIRSLEEQEAVEIAEADQKDQDPEVDPDPSDPEDQTDYKELFDNANNIIKEMETKLQENQAELSKLKNEIAAFNNRQTQEASPEKYDETAVFKELFNNKKQEV